MCDEGMLDYRRIHQGRLLKAYVKGKESSLDQGMREASRMLSAATPESSAVLLSFTHSSEDNYAVLELAHALGISQIYAAGRPSGKGDDILMSADKNPNRAGVQLLAPAVAELSQLSEAVTSGKVKTVLALGSEGESEEAVASLAQAKFVALSTFQGPISAAAAVALPASSWAEADGTFVNNKGLSQVSEWAIAPQGDSRPAWKLALQLAEHLDKKLPFRKGREVAQAVAEKAEETQEVQA